MSEDDLIKIITNCVSIVKLNPLLNDVRFLLGFSKNSTNSTDTTRYQAMEDAIIARMGNIYDISQAERVIEDSTGHGQHDNPNYLSSLLPREVCNGTYIAYGTLSPHHLPHVTVEDILRLSIDKLKPAITNSTSRGELNELKLTYQLGIDESELTGSRHKNPNGYKEIIQVIESRIKELNTQNNQTVFV